MRGAAHPQWKGGVSTSVERSIFATMRQRCCNPNSKKYPEYGGAGIECRFASFEEFFAELGPRPSKRHSVDRIFTFGNYERGNVRWATPEEQMANRRKGASRSISRDEYCAISAGALSFGS